MNGKRVGLCRIGRSGLDQALRRAIGLLGDPDDILPRDGDIVLIKPNIGWDKPWQTGTTTSPHLVQAIIDLLQQRNPSRIIVGESPSIGMVAKDVFRSTGYTKLRGKGVELRDLSKDEMIRITMPENSLLKTLHLPESYTSADYVVNVPVIKTHVNTCVTLSMKNLKGLLPASEKKRFHFLGLDRCIAELGSVIRNDLVLVDGQIGQEGLGPISGTPVKLGIVIAGTNPLAVDTTCIRAMGVHLDRVEHLRIAHGMSLGPAPEDIEQVGDPLCSVSRPFELPPTDFSRAYEGVRILQGDPCSGCIGALTVSLERMAKTGELKLLKERLGFINLAVGPKVQMPERPEGEWVIIGSCLRGLSSHGSYVPGCSPQGWYIRDVLRSLVDLPPLFVDGLPLRPRTQNDEDSTEE